MKVSWEQMAETRERILAAAGKLFPDHGIDGVSVADIMKAAGLTHGGFYRHFESKEDLVAQACARAISNKRQSWMQTVEQAKGSPFKALADTYLTPKHRDNVGNGCPFAAVGGELSRHSPAVRHAVTIELRHFIDSLSRIVPTRSVSTQRNEALGAYASMIGALVLARVVDDPEFSNEILEAAGALFSATGAREPLLA
jgi:TetR/AcrR family transcriptional regulator, transcriptional repressor for nem operon